MYEHECIQRDFICQTVPIASVWRFPNAKMVTFHINAKT